MTNDLEFAGILVPPNSRHSVELPVSRLPNGSDLSLPVQIVNGAGPGPSLWLSAAIHGNEINGVEIIRRVLEHVEPSRLRGALYVVPVVNVFGFLQQSRYLPDGRDLNRSFPGSPRGSLAARIASLFLSEVVAHCQYGVDLHTAGEGRTNLPQVRADLDDAKTLELARAFGAPVLLHKQTRDGSLRECAQRRGARTLLYEGGEPSRFDAWAIEAGVRGVLAVLGGLEMIDSVERAAASVEQAECRASSWIRAGAGGIYRASVDLGQEVSKGESLGFIGDPLGADRRAVRAPAQGVVIGMTTNPLVYRGDALVHLGTL